MSSGQKVSSPDYSKLERKIRRNQRKFSRRIKGSKRRELMRLNVAKLHAKQRDTRKDFLHKLSTKVIIENQVIALEDLNVGGLLKNRRHARAKYYVINNCQTVKIDNPYYITDPPKHGLTIISDNLLISQAGWREFRTMCEAKSTKFEREFVVISRWEPTSQVCSNCGYHWGKLNLSVREIVCLGCSTSHCRDGNASKNIEKVGVGHIHDSKRAVSGSVRPQLGQFPLNCQPIRNTSSYHCLIAWESLPLKGSEDVNILTWSTKVELTYSRFAYNIHVPTPVRNHPQVVTSNAGN